MTGSGQGFGSARREGVEVLLNQNILADFTLSPTVGETVTVTTNAEPINTTNAEIKGRLPAQEILDKPTFIHFDDYFYPYPEKDAAGERIEFPDDANWQKYKSRGGKLARDDWRRSNVNDFIAAVAPLSK